MEEQRKGEKVRFHFASAYTLMWCPKYFMLKVFNSRGIKEVLTSGSFTSCFIEGQAQNDV